MTPALVAFGSNLEPDRNVPEAVRALAERARVTAMSGIYETPPEGAPDSPPFLNGVLRIETDLGAERLRMDVLRPIEEGLGRRRTSDRNAPRSIDLDLIFHGETQIEDPVAHAHVAIPLSEIAPERVGPLDRFARERAAFRRRPDVEDAVRRTLGDQSIRLIV